MIYNKILFNKVIAKSSHYLCDGCAHYLKEHRVCAIFKFENTVHEFIKPNLATTYSSTSNTRKKDPYYCVNHVTGYTVPTLDDPNIFKM